MDSNTCNFFLGFNNIRSLPRKVKSLQRIVPVGSRRVQIDVQADRCLTAIPWLELSINVSNEPGQ
jgi:hypothetical protein